MKLQTGWDYIAKWLKSQISEQMSSQAQINDKVIQDNFIVKTFFAVRSMSGLQWIFLQNNQNWK